MSKFEWVRDRKDLRASYKVLVSPIIDYSNPGRETLWITEQDMEEVQAWCQQTGCGRRMSFDTFRFKRREEITMFLLRWS